METSRQRMQRELNEIQNQLQNQIDAVLAKLPTTQKHFYMGCNNVIIDFSENYETAKEILVNPVSFGIRFLDDKQRIILNF